MISPDLFPDVPRSGSWKRPQDRSDYDWLLRSELPEAENIRNILNDWFRRYPPRRQNELQNRFKGKRSNGFDAVFFELFLHELLLRLGYKICVEPPVSSGRPDFCAFRELKPRFYLEGTVLCAAADDEGQSKQVRRIVEFVNQNISSKFFGVSMRIIRKTHSDPSLKKLKSDLSSWLNALVVNGRPTITADRECAYQYYEWTQDDWRIMFKAFLEDKTPAEGIVGLFCDASDAASYGFSSSTDHFERKIDEKKKYRRLGLPYIIAANMSDFGKRCEMGVHDSLSDRQETKALEAAISKELNSNGAISAILLFNGLYPHSLSKIDYRLYLNPESCHPFDLGEKILSLNHAQLNMQLGQFVYKDGIQINELLGIPPTWPRFRQQVEVLQDRCRYSGYCASRVVRI